MTAPDTTTEETLRHFSEQLQAWCIERIRQQPGPFRHAELSEQLISKQGFHSPPVTLWVNRESFLAGAVILVPQKSDEDSFAAGHEIADILGLPCFFTWGRYEASCWRTDYNPPEKVWEYEFPPEDNSSPATFRKSFNQLMDQLETSFYTHQQEIPRATPQHLTNLVFATYNDLLPIMQQAIQIANPDTVYVAVSPQDTKNALFRQLLLPLALAAHDLLPRSIPVDRTIEVLSHAVAQLPKEYRRAFAGDETEPAIPADCLRRFNHYVSRVAQLREEITDNLPRMATDLLGELAPHLGGQPFGISKTDLELVTINPDLCEPTRQPAIEVAGSGILAANVLARGENNPASEGVQQYTDIMALDQRLPQHLIVGTLHDTALPGSDRAKKLNTFLRISWPNHKLALPARTPVWTWQFIHLCGLLDGESRINLTLPGNWLWERYGEVITGIIGERVGFSRVTELSDGTLNCEVCLSPVETTTVIRKDGDERTVPNREPSFLRSRILIALNLPDEIISLIDTEELQFYGKEQLDQLSENGLSLYLKSTLGRHLWNLLAPGRPTPANDRMLSECLRVALPLPREKTLAALGRLKNSELLSTTDIDQELTVWIGTTSDLEQMPRQKQRTPRGTTDEERLHRYRQACEKEEIPVFPDNYLFNIPTDARTIFTFQGRLKIVDSFFDETILLDREKQQIKVMGAPQAETLVLLSTARSGPLELPTDQKEMTDILDRYIRDLKNLRRSLYRHAVTLLAEEDVLSRVEETWKSLSLPEWDLVKEK